VITLAFEAAFAAAPPPALLLFAAGTASAQPRINPFQDFGLDGVTVHVQVRVIR
jgi:hypothetical protein